MKNYPVHESELPAIRALCEMHGLTFTVEPSMQTKIFWCSIFHPLPGRELSPELCFCLGRSFEIQTALIARNKTGEQARANELHPVEIIDVLP